MPLDNFTSLPQRLVEESDEPLSNYVFSLYLDQGLPAGGRFLLQVTAIAGESMLSRTEQVTVTVNSPPMIGEVKVSFQGYHSLSIEMLFFVYEIMPVHNLACNVQI